MVGEEGQVLHHLKVVVGSEYQVSELAGIGISEGWGGDGGEVLHHLVVGSEGWRGRWGGGRCGWVSAVLHHLVVGHSTQLEEMIIVQKQSPIRSVKIKPDQIVDLIGGYGVGLSQLLGELVHAPQQQHRP